MHVFIRNAGRVIQVGIHQVLDLAVVKKIDPLDGVVGVFDPHHDVRSVFRVAVGQGTYVLQEFGLPFFLPDIDKALFVVEAVLIAVSQQVLDQQALIDHFLWTMVLLAWAVGITTRSAMFTWGGWLSANQTSSAISSGFSGWNPW